LHFWYTFDLFISSIYLLIWFLCVFPFPFWNEKFLLFIDLYQFIYAYMSYFHFKFTCWSSFIFMILLLFDFDVWLQVFIFNDVFLSIHLVWLWYI
jgi:hypothetical protein